MTPNREDYLKLIFELGGDEVKVNNKQIVSGLDVSAASVSEMHQPRKSNVFSKKFLLTFIFIYSSSLPLLYRTCLKYSTKSLRIDKYLMIDTR